MGSLLAIFTKTQADFASDAAGGDKKSVSGITSDQWDLLREAYVKRGGSDPGPNWRSDWANSDWTKSSVEGMIQALKSMIDGRNNKAQTDMTLKSMIDGRNNKAQTDMTRLQQLVDRRDESFSTASTLMTSVSDTRGNLIRNL